jgi:hypothetical protein
VLILKNLALMVAEQAVRKSLVMLTIREKLLEPLLLKTPILLCVLLAKEPASVLTQIALVSKDVLVAA